MKRNVLHIRKIDLVLFFPPLQNFLQWWSAIFAKTKGKKKRKKKKKEGKKEKIPVKIKQTRAIRMEQEMIWARASKFTSVLILHDMLIWLDKKKLQVTQGMASSMSSASAGKLACVKMGTQPGGGYLTEFYTERLRPEVQPRILLYTRQFWKER